MRGMIISYILIFFSPGMQKRGDNTFLWDLVIKDNGYSAIEAKALELWASPSTNVRFSIKSSRPFATKSSHIKNIWLGTAERTRETTTTKKTERNKIRRSNSRDKHWTCKTKHWNCAAHFLADSLIINARLTLTDFLIGMAMRSTKCPSRGSAVCERYRSWKKDRLLKIGTKQHIKSI